MKKIRPAATSFGMKAITLFSSVSSGPTTLPRPSTLRMIISPKSQTRRLTMRPSDSPWLAPLPVLRRKIATLSTRRAKAHLDARARAQVMARISSAQITFSPICSARSSSKR